MKARNFLVFQGDVESLACQQGPALTRLIEQVSGSDALQEESALVMCTYIRTDVHQGERQRAPLMMRTYIQTCTRASVSELR